SGEPRRMENAGPSDRSFHKPRVDGVVFALSRLVATARESYREPLLDVLYQYRRREGLFTSRPKALYQRLRHRPLMTGPHDGRGRPSNERTPTRRRPTSSKGGRS